MRDSNIITVGQLAQNVKKEWRRSTRLGMEESCVTEQTKDTLCICMCRLCACNVYSHGNINRADFWLINLPILPGCSL